MLKLTGLPLLATFPWGHLQNKGEGEQQKKIAVQALSTLVFRKQETG